MCVLVLFLPVSHSLILSLLPRSKPAAAPVVEAKQAVDFFGRALLATQAAVVEGNGDSTGASSCLNLSSTCAHPFFSKGAAMLPPPPPPKRQRQAMYRFNEGFSNAVRVTKRVSDFLV
jgi:hypothetical protein